MAGFLYKERQERKAAHIHGLPDKPDYSKIAPTHGLQGIIRREANKYSR